MPTPDENQKVEEDATSDSLENSRTEAGGEGASENEGQEEKAPRDLGSLAIGGTIGGLVAARALKGAMGMGAKSMAAGYMAKKLRESQGMKDPEVEVPPVSAESTVIPPAAPASFNQESASVPNESEVVVNEVKPPSLQRGEEEVDENLVPSPESDVGLPPAAESRDLGVEALEAESELEEALILMGDDVSDNDSPEAVSEEDSRGGLVEEEAESEIKKAADTVATPPATGGARSPFMRDHPDSSPAVSRKVEKGSDPDGSIGSTTVPAPVAAGLPKAKAEGEKSTLPPPATTIPASPSTSVPAKPAAALTTAIPGAPSGLEGGAALEDVKPLDPGALLEGGTPLVPEKPSPTIPPAVAPKSEKPSEVVPVSQLPGLPESAALPKPAAHLPPAQKKSEPAPSPPAASPKEDEISSFVPVAAPSPAPKEPLPGSGSVLPVEPAVPSKLPTTNSAAPELTEVPLQPAPEVKPLPEVPVQASTPPAPAAPLRDMEPAVRPGLTKAEIAAKERADKIARKKEAKSKGKSPKTKPKKAKKEKKASSKKATPAPKKSKSVSKSARPAPKKAKTGAKSRLLLVGLPILLVLGGAGGFAYMNKDKFGLGASGKSGDVAVDPAIPVGQVKERVKKAPIIPDNIFETPGHVLPGDSDPVNGRLPDNSPIEEPPAALQFTDEELKEIIRDPRKTLEAFLLAGTVDDLIKFVADPEEISKDIRQYYKGGKRTPIAGDIRFDKSGLVPETNLAAYQYWVRSSRREIPVSVEETEQGYRVDWAAFTQFHDAKFEKFLRDLKNPGGEFYVQLRRSHYFGNDLADIDDWHAFRIQSPIAPYAEGFAFLKKSNPEAKAILERYRWSKGYRPFVELGWFTPEGGEPRVELKRIVRPTWRR